MTGVQIHCVKQKYADKLAELVKLEHWKGLSKEYKQLQYLQNMIPRFPDVIKEREKAMRWLCFMQGVFWSLDIYSVDELREHNAAPPTKAAVEFFYRSHSLHRLRPCSACGDLDGCHKWREYEEATV